MPPTQPSTSAAARRTFLQQTSTVLLAGLGLPAHAHAPSALKKPQTITPWFVKNVPASPAPARGVSAPKEVPSGPPLWNPHERVTHWARQTMRLVVKYQQNPLRAARAMAYVQVAMFDAWLHASRMGASDAAAEWAAHRAASLLTEQLYALETPGLFVFLGITPEGQDPAKAPANHSPHFYADEKALKTGTEMFINWVLAYPES